MTPDMIAHACRLAVETLARTWSVEVEGEERVRALRADGTPILFTVWHDQLLAPLWHRRNEGITLLVSAHRDGRRLGVAAHRWGYETVYGSSTRLGTQGLRGLVRALLNGHDGAVTPDGPVGPARIAKLGALMAARRAGAAIVPVASTAEHAWHVPSWDRFEVPAAFARVRIVYGRPLRATPAPGSRSADRRRLQAALCAVNEEVACTV